MAEDILKPFCTVAWADKFFSEFVYNTIWNESTPEKKVSALKSASNFISLYAIFYDEKGEVIFYDGIDEEDFENLLIPKGLKEACAQEASYLLSLDDNPAEPHPLTILGLVSADGKHFDKDYTPPVLPMNVVKILHRMGADVDGSATGSGEIQTAQAATVC